MGTEKIGTQHLHPQKAACETTLLSADTPGGAETTLLAPQDHANETTVLNAQSVFNAFVIEYEITYIHTDEVIA